MPEDSDAESNMTPTTEKRGYCMKKTRHQAFVDELHKQLTAKAVHQIDLSENQYGGSDGDESKEDIMKELERKFDELFGSLDDD